MPRNEAGVDYFCDDISMAEVEALCAYFRASREIANAPLRERPAYQHYASVQFAAFYYEVTSNDN